MWLLFHCYDFRFLLNSGGIGPQTPREPEALAVRSESFAAAPGDRAPPVGPLRQPGLLYQGCCMGSKRITTRNAYISLCTCTRVARLPVACCAWLNG